MIPLYSEEETARLKRRTRRALTAAIAAAAVCLSVCVALCFTVRTRNAIRVQWTVVTVSSLGGWAVILLRRLAILPSRREYAHAESLLRNADAEEHTGVLLRIGDAFRIPQSITLRNVVLGNGENEITLKINENKLYALPPVGSAVRAETRRGYITAIGADHA